MSVTLESIDAKLDQVLAALAGAGLNESKPAGLGLRAEDFDADGAWRPGWLDEVWDRVRKHGNPDPKAPEGTRKIIVASVDLGPRTFASVKAVEVPDGIMARPLIEEAKKAGIVLSEQQQYNIIMSDTRSAFMLGATFGPSYRFPPYSDDPEAQRNRPVLFNTIPGVWSLRVGQNRVTADDIKPRLLEGVAQQCAMAGIAVDLSGI